MKREIALLTALALSSFGCDSTTGLGKALDPDQDGIRSQDPNTTTLSVDSDWCPYVAGPADNHGCPYAYEGRDCTPAGAFAWLDPQLAARGVTFAGFAYPFDRYCKPVNVPSFSPPTSVTYDIPLDDKPGIWERVEKGMILPYPVYIAVRSCQPALDSFMTWNVNGGPNHQESLANCLNITPKCNAVSGTPHDCLFWLPQDGLPHNITVPDSYQIRAFWPTMNVRFQSLTTLPDGSYIPAGSYQEPNCQYTGTAGACQRELIQ